jgi:hypothetical protein
VLCGSVLVFGSVTATSIVYTTSWSIKNRECCSTLAKTVPHGLPVPSTPNYEKELPPKRQSLSLLQNSATPPHQTAVIKVSVAALCYAHKSIPLQALRASAGWGSQNNWYMTEAKLLALRTGRLYPQEISLVPIPVGGWVDPRAIVRLEGLSQSKTSKTPLGIKPATFRLVEQCLNQLRHHVPQVLPY